ncbi:unnamed protein product [Timema podura]|uniref:Uncharacterized protein n=1 Tax=Timema podura TaxID=61482 RepID=A0ABN7NWQ1_TIMPD|nr:unnamed protein product [Timema podura]
MGFHSSSTQISAPICDENTPDANVTSRSMSKVGSSTVPYKKSTHQLLCVDSETSAANETSWRTEDAPSEGWDEGDPDCRTLGTNSYTLRLTVQQNTAAFYRPVFIG